MMQLWNTGHTASMTIYGNTTKERCNFNYVMIEAGCSDNQDVCIKGVWISKGPLYKRNCSRPQRILSAGCG